MPERPRLTGDPCGVALGADGLDDEPPAPSTTNEPDRTLSARRTTGRDSPGEDRLVEREARRAHELAVRDDLVAGPGSQEVADDDLADGGRARRAVPHDGRPRLDERGEPVERAFRAHLLRDPDRRVGEEHAEEEGVLPLAEDERATPQRRGSG